MPNDTELHKKCHQGDLDGVKALIEARSGDGVEEPAEGNASEEVDEPVEQYEENETAVDVNAAGAGGRRPIHRAAGSNSVDIIEYLLQQGALVDQVDNNRRTALHWAAISGHTAAGRCLVSAGADILATTMSSMTPLHAACEGGRVEFVEFLLQSAKVADKFEEMCNARDSDGKLPLEHAAAGKHKAIVVNLREQGDPNAASVSCAVS